MQSNDVYAVGKKQKTELCGFTISQANGKVSHLITGSFQASNTQEWPASFLPLGDSIMPTFLAATKSVSVHP